MGELFEEYSEKNRADLPPLTIIQGGGTVYRDESNRNLQFDKNSLSNYKAVSPDDFIVHLRSFEGGLEKATCCGLISPAYHTFHGDGIDSDFYYLYFRSKRFIDTDLKPHVYGIRDGRSIDIDGMKTISIPWTTVNEQRAIGGFFRSLDSLITLHQRKRRKGLFTHPLVWEQRKFSEIVDVCSGRDYKHLNEGPIPVYGTGGYMTSVSEALSHNRDAIGIGRKGTIDKPYLLKAPFWTVDTLFYTIPKSDINLEFALCSFLNVDWKSKDESTGLPSLSKESINETVLSVPDVVEQNRLGGFFADLDYLITLHQ